MNNDIRCVDRLPEHIANKRGGGALMQLVCYGAPDIYLSGNTFDAQPYNIRSSMMKWFINREDGLAEKDDLKDTRDIELNGIFSHYPDYLKPSELKPFSVKKERAAVKIQKVWRNAISNPEYLICKNRILNEFNDLYKEHIFLKL